MDAHQEAVARECLNASFDDRLSFPDGVKMLMEAGFDGYLVDFRSNTRTCYLADGETLVLENPHGEHAVAPCFDQPEIAAAIAWAQAQSPGYSYAGFIDKVTANGCAGYIVSFSGRSVIYFGRDAGIHVETMP